MTQSLPQKKVGTLQSSGSVLWNVTVAEMNSYLTSVLTNDLNQNGTITSSTIVYSQGLGYWTMVGEGTDGANNSVNIRVELGLDSNNDLWVSASGDTETCSGNPCSHCKFASGGGCECNDQNNFNKCDHTITKTKQGVSL